MTLRKRGERGIVLVMTILVLSVLIVLVYAFTYSAKIQLRIAQNAVEELRERAAAESALNYGLVLLEQDAREGTVDSLDEDWARPDIFVSVGDLDWRVEIVDNNRKLDVNRAFRMTGTLVEQIAEAVRRAVASAGGSDRDWAAIRDWVDADSTGPYEEDAPNLPMLTIQSLWLVPSLDKDLLLPRSDRLSLEELLTSQGGSLNVNTASVEVLEAVLDDSRAADVIVAEREEQPFADRRSLDDLLEEILAPDEVKARAQLLGMVSKSFTISVWPTEGSSRQSRRAVVRREGIAAKLIYVCRLESERKQ